MSTAAPAFVARDSTRGRMMLAGVTLGSGVAILDGSVVNVALRTMGRDLGASLAQLQVLNRALFEQFPVRVITLGDDAPHFDICAVRRSGDVNDRLHHAWTEAVRAALVEAKLAIQPASAG